MTDQRQQIAQARAVARHLTKYGFPPRSPTPHDNRPFSRLERAIGLRLGDITGRISGRASPRGLFIFWRPDGSLECVFFTDDRLRGVFGRSSARNRISAAVDPKPAVMPDEI